MGHNLSCNLSNSSQSNSCNTYCLRESDLGHWECGLEWVVVTSLRLQAPLGPLILFCSVVRFPESADHLQTCSLQVSASPRLPNTSSPALLKPPLPILPTTSNPALLRPPLPQVCFGCLDPYPLSKLCVSSHCRMLALGLTGRVLSMKARDQM